MPNWSYTTGGELVSDQELKKAHERAVGKRFISGYNERFGKNFTLEVCRERPDLEFTDPTTGEQLGVEVLTGYYSQGHAEREWTEARRGPQDYGVCTIHEPDNCVVERVVRKIADKAEESFAYPHPLVLVADISLAVLTTINDFKRIVEGLFFPSPPQYQGIYLLDKDNRVEPLWERK